MRVVERVDALRDALREPRGAGTRIGFVPTMGALHEGHLALVDAARRASGMVVMSVFVNPLQFGPAEDLARYPRDPDGDAGRARDRGVDLLFIPGAGEMYREPRQVTVLPGPNSQRWEGAARPGHFAGVLIVVAKLFNLVQPTVAVFGQKDLQQAAVIRSLIRDLDFPIELIVHPIVRDADDLALSSRNAFLDRGERRRAGAIPRALRAIRRAFERGEHDPAALARAAGPELSAEGLAPEYLAIVDVDTMAPVDTARAGSAAIIAVRVGAIRLLDNTILGAADEALDR